MINRKKAAQAGTYAASNDAFDTCNLNTITDWLSQHSALDAKCGNCQKLFTVARKAKGIVCIPNVANAGQMKSLYVLCRACTRDLKRNGLRGIADAANDAKLAAMLMSAAAGGEA